MEQCDAVERSKPKPLFLKYFFVFLLLLTGFFPLACTRQEPPLLKVENISWTGKDFQQEISLYLKGHPALMFSDMNSIKKKVLKELIFRSLLKTWAQKNIKAPWPASFPSLWEERQFFYKNLQAHLTPAFSVPEKKLRAFYRKHKEKFYQPEQCFLKQILVFKESLAQTLYRRLLRGADFDTLAQLHSRGEKVGHRSQIGWVAKGTLKIFDKACEMEIGTFSQPLKSPYGFHILTVKEKKSGKQKSFAQAKKEISAKMEEKTREMAFQNWLKKELETSSVFVNEKLFDSIHIRYKKRWL